MSFTYNSYAPSIIAPMVQAIVKPKSVVDWGCNCGVWLEAFKQAGASAIFGFDMQERGEDWMIGSESFEQVNFEQYIPVLSCDLAINLENAEHLSSGRADILVDALTESAPTVLFSAATPGQGGDHHVNEQPHSYWHYKFLARGFMLFDPIRWAIKDDPQIYPWYRDNMFLYSKIPLPVVPSFGLEM